MSGLSPSHRDSAFNANWRASSNLAQAVEDSVFDEFRVAKQANLNVPLRARNNGITVSIRRMGPKPATVDFFDRTQNVTARIAGGTFGELYAFQSYGNSCKPRGENKDDDQDRRLRQCDRMPGQIDQQPALGP